MKTELEEKQRFVRSLGFEAKMNQIKMDSEALQYMVPFFCELPFFKNLNLKQHEAEDLLNSLYLEKHDRNDTVMEIGEKGFKFYVIL